MKSELKAKFLQHLLSKKKNNEGFTLIELLVVIIIIGILAAIALPSFLNQANKARQSEASTYVGTINRAQQAYFLEQNTFTEDLLDLEVGLPESTDNYDYASKADGGLTGKTAAVINTGTPKAGKPLKGVGGRVFVLQDKAGNSTTTAVVCTAKVGNGGVPAMAGITDIKDCK